MTKDENFIHDKYGYCRYLISKNKTPLIFGLYTEPEHRGLGYAKKHLAYVINEIRQTGYTDVIEIEVSPQDNNVELERLKKFYINMGLKIINV